MSSTASFRFNVPYRTLRARLCPPSSHVGCGSALSARSSRLRDMQFVRDHPGRQHRFSVSLRATPVNPMGVQRWFKSNSFSLGIVSPAHDQSINASIHRSAFRSQWRMARSPAHSGTAHLTATPASLAFTQTSSLQQTVSFFDPLPVHLNSSTTPSSPTIFNPHAAPSIPTLASLQFGGVLHRRAPPFIFSVLPPPLPQLQGRSGSVSVLRKTLTKRLRRLFPFVLLRHSPAIAELAARLSPHSSPINDKHTSSSPSVQLEFVLQPNPAAILMPDAQLMSELNCGIVDLLATSNVASSRAHSKMAQAAHSYWSKQIAGLKPLSACSNVDKLTKAATTSPDYHKSNRFSLSFSLAQSLLARALDLPVSTMSSTPDHATQTLMSLQSMLLCLQQHPVYACYVSTDNNSRRLSTHRIPLMRFLMAQRTESFPDVPAALIKILIGSDSLHRLSELIGAFDVAKKQHETALTQSRVQL